VIRQPESAAAEPPRRRRVRLHERLEESRLLVRRHADARVRHVDAQQRPVVALLERDRHPHAAPLRELHGVGDEVQQDLSQARRVGRDALRQRSAPVEVEGEALGDRARAHEVGHLGNEDDRRAGDLLERHLARLDLRQVEDVVHDRQQVLAVAADGLHVGMRSAPVASRSSSMSV
jgi:hypothetical protein